MWYPIAEVNFAAKKATQAPEVVANPFHHESACITLDFFRENIRDLSKSWS